MSATIKEIARRFFRCRPERCAGDCHDREYDGNRESSRCLVGRNWQSGRAHQHDCGPDEPACLERDHRGVGRLPGAPFFSPTHNSKRSANVQPLVRHSEALAAMFRVFDLIECGNGEVLSGDPVTHRRVEPESVLPSPFAGRDLRCGGKYRPVERC